MEAVCARGETACEMRALAAALHSLHLYCATISAALICCCAPLQPHWYGKQWRCQNVRGVASLALAVVWCCGAATASLRPAETVQLVAGLMAPLAWLAAAALHIALWTRRSAAPILYLAVYWLLAAVSSAAILWQHLFTDAAPNYVEVYVQCLSMLLALLISAVDCICFYDEVTKRYQSHQKPTTDVNTTYKHSDTHFFAKISFFWLNTLLYRGYESPLEQDDLGELPDNEQSQKYYKIFKKLYKDQENSKKCNGSPSIWRCYTAVVWPNFYVAGIMKLISDLVGVVPPLGLAVVIQYLQDPHQVFNTKHVTIEEFCSNGYVMLLLITLALIIQAFLSQNSTHLVTVEGTRLKTALQGMVYDKCMRLAPWSANEAAIDEDSPLLHADETTNTQAGLLTNLVSQDTYNVMSCVWICHYMWAIPLKIAVILYLLYTKLGASAIVGTAVSILFITPLQFYIGKKISDNSKDIAKWTDHRVSKMTEILQGMHVIKLYVWEDLFNERILNLREVELKLLNKDSIYWSFLTFTTQVSTIIVTVVTFTVYYYLENGTGLTAVNVFAGLALFNQLTIPLLILPVTVLMVIQATVSTKRIRAFLELPESNNVYEDNEDVCEHKKTSDRFNDAFVENVPDDNFGWQDDSKDEAGDGECEDQFSDEENSLLVANQEYLIRFRNAAFTWGMKSDALLEIEDLDIPAGKLIMVVGSTGSGKSSLLSAILGEMYLERGDVIFNGHCSTWYAGQPPWLLEGSVRDNIVMDSAWCQRRYARVLRATGLRPDLQLLPDGDTTHLGSHGAPLSGGQRVRVCVARALYSGARLLALDEPLGALDAALARHVVARALVPAARAGRTVLVATNRLELLHYADLVIVMEDGRIGGFGRAVGDGVLGHWGQLAAEARAAAARNGCGPPGGTARERSRLVRALTQARILRQTPDDATVGINEATGAHLLAEVPTCAGGSWRHASFRPRPALTRQLSSPPSSMQNYKCRRDVRRAVSADESNTVLQREASLLRRLLRRRRTPRTLARWTPRTLRRLLSSDSNTPERNQANGDETNADTTCTSVTSNGVPPNNQMLYANDITPSHNKNVNEEDINECTVWWQYARACGCWGAAYSGAAIVAQAMATAADFWLMRTTAEHAEHPLTSEQMWNSVCIYALWCIGGVGAVGCAQAACTAAGARARRSLHEQLLHATLHAPLHHHRSAPAGATLHRFSADILVIDKKLPTAVSRWAQLALLCIAAMLVNAVMAPWSLFALLPALLFYLTLQTVYLRNARELQRVEARSAASVVSVCAQTCSGAGTVRAGRLQTRMRAAFMRRLDQNHNALLLLNAANRWLGLTLDLVGAASVSVSIAIALYSRREDDSASAAAAAGLAGAYSLLLPTYLAHLAKCRADLDLQLASVERLHVDSKVQQEDYRDDCQIPTGWQRNGKIHFDNISVQHEPDMPAVLHNINISVAPGEKVAICGRSGSGKSTLILSCVGATTIRKGRVLIDGVDSTNVPLRTLRHRMVVLPQEAVMFSGTLRENLDPLAVHTDEEIWQSLRAVGLFDFVHAQPAGLECSVGRPRCGWSGGRAARACAARAALHAQIASALLLDEPGAALDAPAERALLAALKAAAPHTTVITVAHRISSVREYDRAVVLDEGRLVEQGSVRALLAQPTSRLARMLAAATTAANQHT
ncbi:ATP-binding cassette sub-family C member Sur-like isoform X2 [Hyposmocoma kahamanoa]|uniref:ATP-binding cassette sub-family C member Sur-like isoform X2 n=1 Tax=Hyposmocoma kahamanoa TaxID=1477025 RepID=UPI000E6D924A|nr:ATP-binding cassette sub-family C member Sur-like isoform X2 [Hyposmocoma kahamanoa]